MLKKMNVFFFYFHSGLSITVNYLLLLNREVLRKIKNYLGRIFTIHINNFFSTQKIRKNQKINKTFPHYDPLPKVK